MSNQTPKEKLNYIPLNKLDPSPFNPNEMNEAIYEKVKSNIKKTGKYPALIVRPKPNSDRFEIIDVWHRKQIITELGYEEAKGEVWDVDDTQMKLLLATLNRLKGTDDTKKRGKLLADLYAEFGEDKAILNFIPESERSLNSLLDTIKVDEYYAGHKDMEELERGLVEQKLMQAGVDTETAEAIADGYKPPSTSNVWVLKFVFKDIMEYNKAVQFFGKKGDKSKLLGMIDGNEKTTQNTRADIEV